ncbi:MAG: hypothetical protein ALAOOOJD_04605 [bacterium]|nr:hypothetical protein [bacterium]
MTKRACLLALLLCGSSSLLAQTAPQSQPFLMNVDYARFRSTANAGYVELYYSFFCGLLAYQAEGATLKGGVALRTDLIDAATGKAVVNERVVLPVVIEDTTMASWRSMPILRQAGHLVPFGNYRLHIVAYDSLNPARRDSLTMPLEVKAASIRPAISDLELCSLIRAAANQNQQYFKNGHEVVPYPSLVFGAFAPVIYVYAELYDVDTSKVYGVDYEIVGADGAIAKKVSRQRRYRTANTIEIGTLNAVALAPGKYSLRMSVRDLPSGAPAQVQKDFSVYQPPAAGATPAPVATSLAIGIETLTDKEVEEEFQKAKYLADKTEIYFFGQLKTAAAKKDFLKEFWGRQESGVAGERPRLRTDYLRRVDVATERYSNYTRRGWRTDRGRVFILYGKPDEVERHPSEGVIKPYEIWYYYQVENGVQFVFVDKNGFGDYELVHSTKRGEFSDEGWERFLQ